MTNYETDLTYSFEISEKLTPDYKVTSAISNWLKENLETLTDDEDNTIFNRVNTGYTEDNLKHFGVKPVCDVHINRVDYTGDFDTDRTPQVVHTIIIFYSKGANNKAYTRVCNLHDYLVQEFITNPTFQRLQGIVRDTYITNSELMNQPVNKKWGVMGALELSHYLY